MDKAVQEQVLGYVAKWRPRLRLMDWSIGYEWENPDVRVSQTMMDPHYRRGKLQFSPKFPEVSKEFVSTGWLTVEKIVVHELCHLVTAPVYCDARNAVTTAQLGSHEERQIGEKLDNANEMVTEWVARIVWEVFEGTTWDADPST